MVIPAHACHLHTLFLLVITLHNLKSALELDTPINDMRDNSHLSPLRMLSSCHIKLNCLSRLTPLLSQDFRKIILTPRSPLISFSILSHSILDIKVKRDKPIKYENHHGTSKFTFCFVQICTYLKVHMFSREPRKKS